MRRGTRTLAVLGVLMVAGSCGGARVPEEAPRAVAPAPPESLAPLARPPLDPPFEVTASFGEYRRGHFHAGLDFSTGLQVGLPVYAPLDGWVEQVGTSGSGYGRSLRLRAPDGRVVLFGHLDAFEDSLARWVAAFQESTGRYEQELTLDAGRFPVRAGDRVAWSGESGAGPPHLHMELRWGDMAYNPLRYGLTVPDSVSPVLRRALLEHAGPDSWVEGSAAPKVYGLASAPDTIVAEGAVRVWLDAMDGVSNPWPRLAPYAVSLETEGQAVEARFDRILWDDDMTSVEWVYDGSGRVSAGQAIALWFAADYRPAVYSRPEAGKDAGLLSFRPGDPPRVVTLAATDAAGNRTESRLIVRGPRMGEVGPATRPARRARARAGFDLFPSSAGHVRVSFGAPAGSRDVTIGWEGDSLTRASFDGTRWAVVLALPQRPAPLVARGHAAAGAWEQRRPLAWVAVSRERGATLPMPGGTRARWSLPPGGAFAGAFVFAESAATSAPAPGLAPLGPAYEVGPRRLPLRAAATVELPAGGEGAGLYHERDRSWRFAGAERAEPGSMRARVRGLGRFALYADVEAPRIGAVVTRRRTRGAAHGRWSLQCGVLERGSGIDPARTRFVVDGRPVPSEWDAERGVLRWRPYAAPLPGAHVYEVIATDQSGNASRRSGSFAVK